MCTQIHINKYIEHLNQITDAAVLIAGMMPMGLVVYVERRKRDTWQGLDISKPVQQVDDAIDKWQQDRKMDLQAYTEHSRMDQKKTRSAKLKPDTIVSRLWML